ncbi:MAG: FAD:protein FMN transferase [Myxococcota bacterium]|nr:FAD:protein FMN transferase [Myxococcota bacterium]
MGSPCELRLYAPSEAEAQAVAERARDEVLRLERKFSRYRDDSLATRINESAGDARGIELDEETAALLDYAEIVFRESDGLFDPTSGILRQAWDFRSGRLPERDAVSALLPRVGWRKLRWERPRLFLPAGMELDFGGFVKEYAADRVAELCRRQGLAHGLVDLGGDLAVVGPHPDGSPWRVGVRDPRRPEQALAGVRLHYGGLATSGDYERFMIVDGRRYCHLLDPRTGWPVRALASATVMAPHCLVAGTASTVTLLRGRRGRSWLEGLGLPHLTVEPNGGMAGPLASPSGGSRFGHDDELRGPAPVARP